LPFELHAKRASRIVLHHPVRIFTASPLLLLANSGAIA
jgi:hypothetical protein